MVSGAVWAAAGSTGAGSSASPAPASECLSCLCRQQVTQQCSTLHAQPQLLPPATENISSIYRQVWFNVLMDSLLHLQLLVGCLEIPIAGERRWLFFLWPPHRRLWSFRHPRAQNLTTKNTAGSFWPDNDPSIQSEQVGGEMQSELVAFIRRRKWQCTNILFKAIFSDDFLIVITYICTK